jgi:mRNA interferase MazF
MKRGDVVLLDYPYADGSGSKVRPVLIVQNDRDNQRLTNTIVALITKNVSRVHEPTQLRIDVSTPEGQQSGLNQHSVAGNPARVNAAAPVRLAWGRHRLP